MKQRIRAVLSLLLATCAAGAQAQSFPSRPVTIVWPFAAGSAVDGAVRAYATAVSKRLGQQFVVENRPGANGMIGLTALQQAQPDGHFLLVATNGMLVHLPLISQKYQHAPGREYAPVSLMFAQQMVIGAHPSVPFRDLRGLIDHARRNPGALNVATSGTAATTTFATAMLVHRAGIQLTNVPYKGVAQATPDLLANRVQLQVMGAQLRPMVDSGRLVAIAVTGRQRWAQFPGVPTMIESGLPDTWADLYFGLLAPARTPPAVVAALNAAFSAAMESPEVTSALQAMHSEPVGSSPEALAARIRSDQEYWQPIVRAAGIKADD